MARPFIRGSGLTGVLAGSNADVAALAELVSHLAGFILSLESEQRDRPDAAVLNYVCDAVTAEIGHRRRERELARALAAIEQETTAAAIPASKTAGIESRPTAPPRAAPQAPDGADPEDVFYRALVAERAPVHLRCLDGYDVPSAIVRDVSVYALLVETADGQELFLKRSVISIVRR